MMSEDKVVRFSLTSRELHNKPAGPAAKPLAIDTPSPHHPRPTHRPSNHLPRKK